MELGRFGSRDAFLRRAVPRGLARLSPSTSPVWGDMSPQQMLEHLLWAVEMSTGRHPVDAGERTPEHVRLLDFLESETATPRGYMNPLLVDGLPPLRFQDLDEARVRLLGEVQGFLDLPEDARPERGHPIFGPLTWDQWHSAHYKHFLHHLSQFGLVDDSEG